MILGIGSDIVHVDRFDRILKRFGSRFINRVFTPQEQVYAQKSLTPVHVYAKRFAAKEAFAKAIGTGFRGGLQWREIEVLNDRFGKPCIVPYGTALEIIKACQGLKEQFRIHLSLADEKNLAQAFVILETV